MRLWRISRIPISLIIWNELQHKCLFLWIINLLGLTFSYQEMLWENGVTTSKELGFAPTCALTSILAANLKILYMIQGEFEIKLQVWSLQKYSQQKYFPRNWTSWEKLLNDTTIQKSYDMSQLVRLLGKDIAKNITLCIGQWYYCSVFKW